MRETLRVVAHIMAVAGREDEVRSILETLLEPTRGEPGCIRYELLQSLDAPTDFTFVEEWGSEVALDVHLESDHVRRVFRECEGLLTGPPDVGRFRLVG